jgi:fatty-acyl-CoA synthase
LFLRLPSKLDTTATFKHRKVDFAGQGFDPSRVGDPLYFRDDSAGTYVPIDHALYERLCAGTIRL